MAARRPWTRHPRAVEYRRRSPNVHVAMGAAEGFRVHRTGRSAALVAHFGFISLFPLFLVFTTVLGFLLQNDPSLRQDIVDSALSRLPIIGPTLASEPEALRGSVMALVVGLLLAVWSGLKAFVALQGGLDDINDVPLDDRLSFVQTRLRALGAIGVVGVAQGVSASLTSIVTAAGLPAISNVLLLTAATLLNTSMLALSYRWLTSATTEWRTVWPGAVVAGVGFAALQVVGTRVIARTQDNASSVYGDFATVIALLAWLSLHATAALLGAEVNRARILSPAWVDEDEAAADGDADTAFDAAPPDAAGDDASAETLVEHRR